MSNSVCWFEVYVNDMNRAKKFYETVFERKLEKLGEHSSPNEPEMFSFPGDMNSYGSNGALVKMEGYPAGGLGTIVYFSSEDCSIEEKRAEENGGKVQRSKFSIGPHGFISLLSDTEGNIIGLHSMK